MDNIGYLASIYAGLGSAMTVIYMAYVGNLISIKYSCSLMDGIARFERADSFISNCVAVAEIMLIWPLMIWWMINGSWKKVLQEMVDENDF